MWLQARFTPEELHAALGRVTPARIPLDKDDHERCLWVSAPESLSFRGDRDVVVTAHAQIRWDVIGLPLPVTLKRVTLAVTPSIEKIDGQEQLVLAVTLEEADLTAVPAFLESTLIGLVNEALAKPEARIVWPFLETLDFSFKLPILEPVRTMLLYARWGTVHLTDQSLELVVGWGVDAALRDPHDSLVPPECMRELGRDQGPAGGPRPGHLS